jgi:excisionase family DNA binding protein
VAEYLGVPLRTLDQWAYWGTGPAYSKIGRHRRYRWEDVERYVTERQVKAA